MIVDSTFTNNSASVSGAIGTSITTTVRSSLIQGNEADGNGGGLLVYRSPAGPVMIVDSALRQNIADNAGGALAFGSDSTTDVISSTITGNTSTGSSGGGIINLGALTVQDTTVANNSAAANAGGIRNEGALTIQASIISGNTTTGYGGGLINVGQLEMTNSTISGNESTGTDSGIDGAGALLQFQSGELPAPSSVISSSTIVSNTAATNTGGIWLENGPIDLEASIVAGNSTSNFQIDGGTFTSQGYNLTNSATSPLDQTTDITDTAALLGPLADNGGPTMTHLPLDGSPAIDAMPVAECDVATDQRGIPRPQNDTCDIGAVEAEVIFDVWLPILVK
jgi:hypothetical protein